MYRVITGACKQGVKDFVDNKQLPEKLSIKQVIKLTVNNYGHDSFKRFYS